MLPAFLLYLLFVVSWFLRFTVRLPVLAAVRFDLILVLAITALVLLSPRPVGLRASHPTASSLLILILFIIGTIPFVEWPGSVIKNGTEDFLKALVFYYFTAKLLNTERRLGVFLIVFVSAQLFRVVEPLYLHVTEGYWGDAASMANLETLERLAGSPYDTINPNGLAFVILTVIPFLYFLWRLSIAYRMVAAVLIPLMIYTLVLTGSRSGMIGLLAMGLTICLQAKRKLVSVLVLSVAAVVAVSFLSPNEWDRVISIVDPKARNAATAEGRVTGVLEDLEVALRRPLFGHGLGTSQEANAHFRGSYMRSHNLYTEVAQELGFVGLALFLRFMLSVLKGFSDARTTLERCNPDNRRMRLLLDSMQVWLYTCIVFSFASYGLSTYQWYLLAGLSAVSQRIVERKPEEALSPSYMIAH